ncbi:MAG: HAD family hydrolase [Ilumatobacteraceae bacterium]|nr:HAD family hydrolase [Ilumatobacteraceae bacterium]
MKPVHVLAFDADDTLWHSEDHFHATELAYYELLAPYVAPGFDIKGTLTNTQRINLPTYGYGVKAFSLSMVEAAISMTDGNVPSEILTRLIDMGRELLLAPVRLLNDVPEILSIVAEQYRLVLITKGDLMHQSRKIELSGLKHFFEHVEVVQEKDIATYGRIFNDLDIDPREVCMIGNSVKSDISPILELGGHAVHIPYPVLWELEKTEHPMPSKRFGELATIADLPAWLHDL